MTDIEMRERLMDYIAVTIVGYLKYLRSILCFVTHQTMFNARTIYVHTRREIIE